MRKIPTFLSLTASALLCQCETTDPDFASASDNHREGMAATAEAAQDPGSQRQTRQWQRAVALMREHAKTMGIGTVAAAPAHNEREPSSTRRP